MKILHLVSSPTLTGPADPALGLARAQRALLGLDARLACDHLRPGNLVDKAASAGVPVLDGLRMSTKGGLLDAVADLRALRRLADAHDVVHAHTSHDHALAVLARGRAKLVRTIHHPRSLVRRGLQGWAYGRTDGFVLIAEAHRAWLCESYPRLERVPIAIARGAVDVERFRPGVDGGALRVEHGIPADAHVVGMVSRIKPGRRHEVVLDAFARARAQSASKLHLVFVGKGEGEPALRAAIAARGLESVSHLYGFRELDLPEAYASMDVSVLLSEGNDAGCRAVLESLAAGVPVIGARWPAITEALEGTEAGRLVDPDDVEAVASAILELAAVVGPAREARSRSARARVEERFTERVRADAVLALYARLLGRPS